MDRGDKDSAALLVEASFDQELAATREGLPEKSDVSREQLVDSQVTQMGSASPSPWLVSQEQREQFDSALSRMPVEWCRVIQWRHRDNLSFLEIGRLLGKSEDTARRLWARAVRQLQLELQAHEARAN